MRSIAALLATVAIASPALAGGPIAVEPEPTVAPVVTPVVAPGIDWSGAYAGVQLGYADVDSNDAGLDGNGFLGGIHGGYLWDFGNVIAGAEVSYDSADIDLGDAGATLDDMTRLKLLVGTEMGRSLVYGALGAAHASATDAGGADLSDTGWFLGAGLDYAVSDRWTVGAEVLHHQFDDFDGTGTDFDVNTLQAKVSMRF